MKIIFLGTNGWYATQTGNTVSVLINTPKRYIVFDAGDGLHRLDKYATEDKPVDIFLSHFHLDHTIGLHIQPKFSFKNKMRIFGQPGTKKTLSILVNNPFTAPYSILEKRGLHVTIHELCEGENKIDEYKIIAAPLIHADPCWGFRLEISDVSKKKKIISYCTDTGPCENLIKLSKNADVLITECSLLPTDELTPSWPHMNPHAAANAAKEAGVKKLLLSHFAAHKYTSTKLRLAAQETAQKIFANTIAASDEFELNV